MKTDKQTEAFISSAGHEFNSQKLNAFTPQRQGVAARMGMTWPWISDEDRITKRVKVGKKTVEVVHYKQSYTDCIFAIWLCLQSEARIDAAEIDPDEAKRDAWKWAADEGVGMNTALAGEAAVTWIKITNEITLSRGKPIPKHKPGEGDDDSGEL